MLLIQILKTSKEANRAYKGNTDYILVVLFGIKKKVSAISLTWFADS